MDPELPIKAAEGAVGLTGLVGDAAKRLVNLFRSPLLTRITLGDIDADGYIRGVADIKSRITAGRRMRLSVRELYLTGVVCSPSLSEESEIADLVRVSLDPGRFDSHGLPLRPIEIRGGADEISMPVKINCLPLLRRVVGMFPQGVPIPSADLAMRLDEVLGNNDRMRLDLEGVFTEIEGGGTLMLKGRQRKTLLFEVKPHGHGRTLMPSFPIREAALGNLETRHGGRDAPATAEMKVSADRERPKYEQALSRFVEAVRDRTDLDGFSYQTGRGGVARLTYQHSVVTVDAVADWSVAPPSFETIVVRLRNTDRCVSDRASYADRDVIAYAWSSRFPGVATPFNGNAAIADQMRAEDLINAALHAGAIDADPMPFAEHHGAPAHRSSVDVGTEPGRGPSAGSPSPGRTAAGAQIYRPAKAPPESRVVTIPTGGSVRLRSPGTSPARVNVNTPSNKVTP